MNHLVLKLLGVVLAASMLCTTACRTTQLVDPEPLATMGLTQTQVRSAVIKGLTHRRWVVVDDRPGEMVASVTVRGKHSATVNINYAGSNVKIGYVDSQNLSYGQKKDGTTTIHPNYMSWVNNLRISIAAELQMMR